MKPTLPLDEINDSRITVRINIDKDDALRVMAKFLGVKKAELCRIMIENELQRIETISEISQIRSR